MDLGYCRNCGRTFQRSPAHQVLCSKKCSIEYLEREAAVRRQEQAERERRRKNEELALKNPLYLRMLDLNAKGIKYSNYQREQTIVGLISRQASKKYPALQKERKCQNCENVKKCLQALGKLDGARGKTCMIYSEKK